MLLLLSLCLAAACAAPSYYSQAVSGQLQLLRQRQDIADLLGSESTGPELARQLKLSVEIRAFAVARLRLPDNGSYAKFVQTGRDAVTWNVVAAPEFSLEPRRWCFPVSGCVPYRGYFDLEKAQDFAQKLDRKGYDTAVSPAIAYSTLGWFDDPLLDTMFRYGDEQLAGFIFHELAHQELYVSGDAAFNESYAGFIEETGIRLWLESSGQEDRLTDWLNRRNAGLQLNALLRHAREQLGTLYASGAPESQMRAAKPAVFEELTASYEKLVEEQWSGRSFYAGLFSGPLNNADLALADTYTGGTCLFEQLYREGGQDMAIFQQLARARAALDKKQRQAWLNQPCPVIAPGSDM